MDDLLPPAPDHFQCPITQFRRRRDLNEASYIQKIKFILWNFQGETYTKVHYLDTCEIFKKQNNYELPEIY